MNALVPPADRYLAGVSRDERRWLVFAGIWCLVLFVAMYAWQAFGHQKTPIESYRIEPAEFRALTESYVAEHRVGDVQGVPIAVPNADGEAFLAARAFAFQPVLQLKKGVPVRIYLSSYDFQHGLSIQPLNLNFQVLPGYVYVVNLTPTTTGEFGLICNEYCGLGHHTMTGRIIVTD
jgi:cytochrome c oxidase subunit II